MTDDKENIPDAGKVDIPHVGKGRACQCCSSGAGSARPCQGGVPKDKGKQANKAKDAAKPRRGRPVRMTRRPPTRPSRSFGARTVNMAAFGGVPIPLRRSVCVCLHLTAEHQGVVSKRPEAETAVLYC